MSAEPLPFDPIRPGRAHFVGLGGVGMAGVAFLLRRLGWEVSGCDGARGPLLEWLERRGIPAVAGHDPAHLEPRPDLVVRTPAVHDDNPELAAARAAGVPVLPRGKVLAALSERIPTVAVCGSHGKTTTATFLATILRALRPERTWWCIGGTSRALDAVAGGPDDGGGTAESLTSQVSRPTCDLRPATREAAEPLLVAEADESDGTLALYRPALTVVTNVDLDHVDRFESIEAFEQVFRDAIARTAGPLVFCADHPRCAALAASSHHKPRVSFGFGAAADYRLLESAAPGGAAALRLPAGEDVPLPLPVPGRHNLLNAAAAIAAAVQLGLDARAAARALCERAALPARRFERVGAPEGFSVVSDYSHHPSEIRALVATAQGVPHRRLVAVFQPHRFTRTKTFLDDFPPAFRGVDELVLCPVYAASEPPLAGGTSADLYAAFRKAAGGKSQIAGRRSQAAGRDVGREACDLRPAAAEPPPIPVPVFAESLEDAFRFLAATIREGDLVLVVGAGDVDSLAPRLAAVRPAAAPPASFLLSAYGTRAPAPRFRVLPSLAALRAALAETHAAGEALRVLGAGTNTLVAATGFHGPLARLRGPDFSSLDESPGDTPDTVFLDVGAAVSGTALLEKCRASGLAGLEALVGIPGVVGGWLAMNAGTRHGSFCDVVESVRALDETGTERVLRAADLRAAYRACPGLAGFVAASVRLRLRRSTPEAVRARMKDLSEKRLSFAGLRTCGSVFKNPPAPAPTAGQLSDRALCKGLRVGGAHVAARHANVIATDAAATPSDVQALVHLVADRVRAASGVLLEPELRILR